MGDALKPYHSKNVILAILRSTDTTIQFLQSINTTWLPNNTFIVVHVVKHFSKQYRVQYFSISPTVLLFCCVWVQSGCVCSFSRQCMVCSLFSWTARITHSFYRNIWWLPVDLNCNRPGTPPPFLLCVLPIFGLKDTAKKKSDEKCCSRLYVSAKNMNTITAHTMYSCCGQPLLFLYVTHGAVGLHSIIL